MCWFRLAKIGVQLQFCAMSLLPRFFVASVCCLISYDSYDKLTDVD